jgi:CheY-like chemotaxis protein
MSSGDVPVPVLVVDDHLAFRNAARGALDTGQRFVVVGEAESGEEAVALAMKLRPELVVMDVLLPGIDGIEATRRILINDPETSSSSSRPAGSPSCRPPSALSASGSKSSFGRNPAAPAPEKRGGPTALLSTRSTRRHAIRRAVTSEDDVTRQTMASRLVV